MTTTANCPDCGEERLLVEVEGTAYCCTACDAALVLSGAA